MTIVIAFEYLEHMGQRPFSGDDLEKRLDRYEEQEPRRFRRPVRNATEHNEQARENVALKFGRAFVDEGNP